jgi:TonB family protein
MLRGDLSSDGQRRRSFVPTSRSIRLKVRSTLQLLVVVGLILAAWPAGHAQHTEDSGKAARKLIAQVDPDYPADLKRAAIGGLVRLDIVVAPGGKVEDVVVAGGNPILAESAVRAVKRWKYAPASSSTNLRINVRFDPHH